MQGKRLQDKDGNWFTITYVPKLDEIKSRDLPLEIKYDNGQVKYITSTTIERKNDYIAADKERVKHLNTLYNVYKNPITLPELCVYTGYFEPLYNLTNEPEEERQKRCLARYGMLFN